MKRQKKKRAIKLRFGIVYLSDARIVNWRKFGGVYGATALLENAIGQAARHVERSLLLEHEYAKAVVYDRVEERILFIYSRGSDGVIRKDYRNVRVPL